MRLNDTHSLGKGCRRSEMSIVHEMICSYVEREVGEVTSQQAVSANECVHIFAF